VNGPRLDIQAPQDAPVIVFRRAFQGHERLDELLTALLSRSRERQGQ